MSLMTKFISPFLSNRILLVIILLGFILRFYNLSGVPISLNHDETALGYNAYSILKTGSDEYGKYFPLSLKSFGDWKLPVYPLVDILPIVFFGLTEFAVRFPSAVAGVVAIPLIYILSVQVFRNKKIGLIASFFLAVSPWGIFFSRIAYEANLATTFFLAGIICFYKFYIDKKSSKWLIGASFLWGLTIFTYHAFVLFAPIYFITACLFVYKSLNEVKSKWTILSFIVFLLFVLLSVYSTISSGSLSKLSTTSLFNDERLINDRVNILRGDESYENEFLSRLLHNKYSAVAYQIGQNYVSSYSPEFLFDKGGEKFLHNVGTFGNFYLIDSLFLVIGLVSVLLYKKNKLGPLIAWFVLGPIPSAITTDAPSSTRLYLMLPLFVLLSSLGAFSIINYLVKTSSLFSKLTIIFLVSLFTINFLYFIDLYFVHMNYHRAQYFHYGYKEAVELSNKYKDYEVQMYDPTNFPYISFLFYNMYDPEKFQREVEYYPENFGPFYYVRSFGRFKFVDDIDYENLHEKTLYIDYRGIRDEDFKILDPSGKPVFKYFFKE